MSSKESVDGSVFPTAYSTSDLESLQCLQKIKENVSEIQQKYPHVTLDSIELFDYKVKRDSTNRVILHQVRLQAPDVMLSVRINTKGHMTFRQISSPPSGVHAHQNRMTLYNRGLLSQIETITLTPGEDWTRYDTSRPDTDGKQVLNLINVHRTKLQQKLPIRDVDPQLQWYWNINRDDYDRIVSCEAVIKANTGDSSTYYVMISDGNLTIKLIITPQRHAQKHARSHANMVQTENRETLGFLSIKEDIITTNVVQCLDSN